MPSSHSATVTALAVAVGLQDGIGGSTFATALILATIVIAGGLLGIMTSTIIYLISHSGNNT
ncbi:hypothetical protein Hdeb2414_s0010g00350491 [Helianthus debilis subsp. tardiflorus]